VTLFKNVSFTIEDCEFPGVPVKVFSGTPAASSGVYFIPEALEGVKKGLQDAAEGKTVYRGSFAKYAKAPKAEPEGLVLGDNVMYYKNGWRVGRYDGMEKSLLLIMPIGKNRHIRLAEANVEPIEDVYICKDEKEWHDIKNGLIELPKE
jgi:hypothetical protein